MRYIRILLLSLCALSATNAYAQNPPFSHPSLDSNCYFPQIGDRTEMDTVVGWKIGHNLGSPYVRNLGPKPDGGYGNMFIGNLTPPPVDPIFTYYTLSQVQTGPGFNLHHMKQYLQRANPDDRNGLVGDIKPIHFRDRSHLDLYVRATPSAGGIIYLADDNGNYDTNNYVILASSLHGDLLDSLTQYSFSVGFMPAYITRLTSDTLDDVVAAIYTRCKVVSNDSSYLLLFKGRTNVSAGDTLYEDASCILYPSLINSPYRRAIQGDFRGTGRDDWIIAGDTESVWAGSRYGDLFFFANDPPFTLQKLAHAINYDTLMTAWQNPHLVNTSVASFDLFTMPAFPKRKTDRSTDLLITLQIDTEGIPAIFLFRGGVDFGSHRITLDSAGYVIRNPFGNGYAWPLWVTDAGDMTGSGYHVLRTTGSPARHLVAENFYVTGEALDDKIDLYNVHPYGEGQGDTLTANNDNLEDYLSDVYVDIPEAPGGAGSLWLTYGSRQIPVHLNPLFADVRRVVNDKNASIEFSPNPVVGESSVVTIDWPRSESAQLKVYDLLGNIVLQNPIMLEAGVEQQHVAFPSCPSGVYEVVIQGSSAIARTNVVVTR